MIVDGHGIYSLILLGRRSGRQRLIWREGRFRTPDLMAFDRRDNATLDAEPDRRPVSIMINFAEQP